MSSIFTRVAERANEGGLPIGAEGVREIDRLLFEERMAIMRRGSAQPKTMGGPEPAGEQAAHRDRPSALVEGHEDRTSHDEGGR